VREIHGNSIHGFVKVSPDAQMFLGLLKDVIQPNVRVAEPQPEEDEMVGREAMTTRGTTRMTRRADSASRACCQLSSCQTRTTSRRMTVWPSQV
jgi:hypothetical protein